MITLQETIKKGPIYTYSHRQIKDKYLAAGGGNFITPHIYFGEDLLPKDEEKIIWCILDRKSFLKL